MRDRRKKRNTNGFTLVELIVVLMILAILAALLVPALTGYINKAKKKKLAAECRQAVTSAQSLYSEVYARAGVIGSDRMYKEIEKLAEVPGRVTDTKDDLCTLKHLTYVNDGMTVIYCKEYQTAGDGHKELYNLDKSEDSGGDGPGEDGPDEPESGDGGNGKIVVGSDGTLTYKPGSVSYEELKAEADKIAPGDSNKPMVRFPAGIYQVGGKSWIVTKEFTARKDMFGEQGMQSIANNVNAWSGDTHVLPLGENLVAKEDAESWGGFASDKVTQGTIYEFEGAYYIWSVPGGGATADPMKDKNWVQVDQSYFE